MDKHGPDWALIGSPVTRHDVNIINKGWSGDMQSFYLRLKLWDIRGKYRSSDLLLLLAS